MIFLFLWDRLRYDLVALLALLAAVLGGIVPADHAFSGFANPVVPLIAGALIVSAAIARSGAVEVLVRWLTPLLRSSSLQVGVLVACVAALSAFVKNVGALAIFMPVAFQVARRNERSPSEFLMPLAFASLLGGSMTLIGTSPNMLTATVRQELEGAPFRMFDFLPVALGTALCGVVFLGFGWRLIPRGRRSRGSRHRVQDRRLHERAQRRVGVFVCRPKGGRARGCGRWRCNCCRHRSRRRPAVCPRRKLGCSSE